jgi:hypothetical protein
MGECLTISHHHTKIGGRGPGMAGFAAAAADAGGGGVAAGGGVIGKRRSGGGGCVRVL